MNRKHISHRHMAHRLMAHRHIAVLGCLCLCLSALLFLTSCNLSDLFGMAGITTPPTAAGTQGVTTPVDTSPTVSEMDFSGADMTQYLSLDYKGLPLEVAEIPDGITDAELEAELHDIMLYYQKYTLRTDRATAAGDHIEMAYIGTMEGTEFEGGTSDRATILLDTANSGYIAGFADGLIGVTPGQTVTLNLNFPTDYYEDLAGKAVVFTVTVKGICVFDYNDSVASELSDGEYPTADGYREHLREYLKQLEDYNILSTVYEQIIDKLVARAEFISVPEQQYQYYYQYYVNYCISQSQQYGMTYDAYLSSLGYTDETLKSMATDAAKVDLVIYYVAQAENITMTDEEYSDYLEYLVSTYNAQGYNYTADYIEGYYNYYYGEGYLRRQALDEAVYLAVYSSSTLTEAPETTAAN